MDDFSCYLVYLTADREAETFFNSDWSSFGKDVAAAHVPHVSLYGEGWDLQAVRCLTEGFLQTFSSKNNSAQLGVQSDQPGVKQALGFRGSAFCLLPLVSAQSLYPSVLLNPLQLSWQRSVGDKHASPLGNGRTGNTEESYLCLLDCSPSKTMTM